MLGTVTRHILRYLPNKGGRQSWCLAQRTEGLRCCGDYGVVPTSPLIWELAILAYLPNEEGRSHVMHDLDVSNTTGSMIFQSG